MIKKMNSAFAVIIIAYIAFISLGMPDGLHGVAWPGIRSTFNLPIDAISLLLLFGTAGYMLSSFFSGSLVRKLGVGGLLGLSCAATGSTLLVYAVTPLWWLFAAFAILGGLGAGAIDAGLNNYVATHHNVRTMQWLHASFGVGISIGPFIMTAGIAVTGRWQNGYFIVAAFQLILALLFTLTRGLWTSAPAAADTLEHAEQEIGLEAKLSETLRFIPALLSILLFFLYTGIETGIGLWSYTLLTESRGISPAAAGIVTGSYWTSFTIGRILAGWLADRISALRLSIICILSAAAGVLLVLVHLPAPFAIAGIALAGLSIAPLFPALVSDTRRRVGKRHLSNTIGIQIAAAGFGGALVPSIAGVLAGRFGLEIIPDFIMTDLALLLIGVGITQVLQKSEKDQ